MLREPWHVHEPDCTIGTDAWEVFYGKAAPAAYYGHRDRPAAVAIPEFLQRLQSKVEAVSDTRFNFIEVHRFLNTVQVRPHYDPAGCVTMVTLGQERYFKVGGYIEGDFENRQHKDFPDDSRGPRLTDVLLQHGSLLIFYGRVAHSMEPTQQKESRDRITLIFRWTTDAQVSLPARLQAVSSLKE